MLIEISELHPAPAGKKMASVVAAGGAKLECWPEMLSGFKVGSRYECEIQDREYQGRTFRRITKAVPYAAGDPMVAVAAATRTVSPAQRSNGNSCHRSSKDNEQAFVCATLGAFIKAGKVEPELGKVTNAIAVLRAAYQRTFGADDEAARQ
jgi:hypothetical protein